MKLSDLQKKCESIFESGSIGLELYFLLKNENDYDIVSVSLAGKDLEQILLANLEKSFSDVFNKYNQEILLFSQADERKDVLYEYDLENIPMIEKIKNSNVEKRKTGFDVKTDSFEKVAGIIYRIGTAENLLTVFCKNYSILLIKKSKSLVLFSNGTVFSYAKDDMLKLNFSIDFIFCDDKFIIKNLKLLEKEFSVHNLIRNAAIKSVGILKKMDILENPDYLSTIVDKPVFSRKLMSVGKSIVISKNIDSSAIIKFLHDSEILKNKFVFSSDNSKLRIKNQKQCDLFLKIINDDILLSQLTQIEYDSLAKTELK